ncbi:hypothetical protein ACFW9U_17385 [Rhodococcus aetherivorans]|uniref:hypothetical protein n=1 Tax=Rhodococcus aetherivorans TaxID=191292 RepID=UPI00367115B3
MIEVEATHITTGLTEPLLVCELYPGILVLDTYSGPFTVLTYGNRVKRLPAGQGRTFPIREHTAELAAKEYDEQVGIAEDWGEPWPPPEWLAVNK